MHRHANPYSAGIQENVWQHAGMRKKCRSQYITVNFSLMQDVSCNKVTAVREKVDVVNHKNRNWKQNAFAG